MFRRFLQFVLALAVAAAAHAQPAPESRLALLIGNSNYRTSPLRNPVNDVRLMETALKQAGFRVFRAENVNRREMQRLVRDFGELLKRSGGVGLFYFSGHGLQVKGSNYLVPVDSDLQTEDEVPFDSLDAQIVLEKMESAGNRMNLLILDACRSNPFMSTSRNVPRGLAQMNAPSGTIVAYATSPGNVALDGAGANSPYTRHLAHAILQPGVPVEEVFKQVRTAVRRDTGNAQTPWENTALEGQFYFRPSTASAAQPVPSPSAAASVTASQQTDRLSVDIAFWSSIRDSTRPEELQAYLAQFPEGQFAALARARLSGVLAPGAAAASSRPEAGQANGQYEMRDELTGLARQYPLTSSLDTQGNTLWSSGDTIRSDGQAVAVRIGMRVLKVASGALWRFPLAAGQSGEAGLGIEGMQSTARLRWSVGPAGANRLAVTGQVEIPISTSGLASLNGSWYAEYEGGGMVPIAARADLRPSSVGGHAGPEKTAFRLEAVTASARALGTLHVLDGVFGKSSERRVTAAGEQDGVTLYSTGDAIGRDGLVKGVAIGEYRYAWMAGTPWKLPLPDGTSGKVRMSLQGDAGNEVDIVWKVVPGEGGQVLEAVVNEYRTGRAAGGPVRTGTFKARYAGAGPLPREAEWRMRPIGTSVAGMVQEIFISRFTPSP